jgi:hypothetical protein
VRGCQHYIYNTTTTTDELAQMINAGFNTVTKDIGEIKQEVLYL